MLRHTERKSWMDLKSTSSTSLFPLRLRESYCITAVGYSTDRSQITTAHTFSHQEQEPAEAANENSQRNVLKGLGVRFLLCIATLLFVNCPPHRMFLVTRTMPDVCQLNCKSDQKPSASQRVAYSFSPWFRLMCWHAVAKGLLGFSPIVSGPNEPD